jgi:integrase
MQLNKAREEAEDALNKIRKGVDPNLEKRQQARDTEKAREREKITVGYAFERYLAFQCGEDEGGDHEGKTKESRASANTIRDLEKAKKRLEIGALWKLPIEEVDDQALLKEYRRLCRSTKSKRASNGGKTAAGGIFRYLRAAFNRAARIHKIRLEDNPFQGLNSLEKGWQIAPARQTIIADAEGDIGRWWEAVEALRLKTDARASDAVTLADWLQVALLLGGRKTESISMRWEDIDFERGVGVFRKTKRGLAHFFPMAPYVRSILERRKADSEKAEEPSEYVFPASRTGWKSKKRTHIQEPKATIKEVKNASGISFAPHDLRRTFGTLLNELNVSSYTVKKALNHAPDDVASRHYIQTRLKTMLPIYERFETHILTEAGVSEPKETITVEIGREEWEEFQRLKAQQAKA